MNSVESRPVKTEHLALLLSLGFSLGYQYFVRIGLNSSAVELHYQILNGTALSPYRYRILVPFVVEQLSKVMSYLWEPSQGLIMAYRAYQVVAISFSLVALYLYMRTLFPDERALLGTLLAAGTMGLTFQDHFFQPWSLIEPGIVAMGFLLIRLDKRVLLGFFIPLATLNRETAVMIPAAFIAVRLLEQHQDRRLVPDARTILTSALFLVEWGVVFYGLRLLRGSAPQIDSPTSLWLANTNRANLSAAESRIALFLGASWVFALLGYEYSPPFVRATALVAPLYLGLTFTFALWWETRLLMPLYSTIIPLGLFYIFRETRAAPTVPRKEESSPGVPEEAVKEPEAAVSITMGPYPSRKQRKRGTS